MAAITRLGTGAFLVACAFACTPPVGGGPAPGPARLTIENTTPDAMRVFLLTESGVVYLGSALPSETVHLILPALAEPDGGRYQLAAVPIAAVGGRTPGELALRGESTARSLVEPGDELVGLRWRITPSRVEGYRPGRGRPAPRP